jgi:hypothetical protein
VFCEAETGAILERLSGTALRTTRSQADAEDLVADTVFKAPDTIASLQDRQCFHWLDIPHSIQHFQVELPQEVGPPRGLSFLPG